ncbi:ribose-5-phosphate isomerase RpiA [Pedobacter metabolipauper]|uniref:Ribose-5-phosphate isomerase A n=1 Tax=Pedobacter metabolipauper TaxID=425513 RepID=A0A4R6T1K3_9SPHI|nr:ribose-5-phosphate isomerase RpiA [Pedobacter metabolipauper]TDQ11360.1 ribose-5-phosphate isomerase [Pedobacter metabolipauper]
MDLEKQNAANAAVKMILQHDVVGLGTGSTAYFAIAAIADLVKNGLKIKAVATSKKTESLAVSMGIELLNIEDVQYIDITIDGADEFNEQLQLIKGGGGALFREKIVASLSKKEIIIADSAKKVDQLGKFKVPIEVVPLASSYVKEQLKRLDGISELRKDGDSLYRTDNGNYILDADFGLFTDAAVLAERLNQIEGILAHGLFINLSTMVIMGKGSEVITYQ